jgi:outer membrane receptor protein involved in Fe transport
VVERAWPARLALSLIVLALGNTPVTASEFAIRIPAEPLAQALIDLAVQTQLSVSETGVDFGTAKAKPLSGTYTPEEALSVLLRGTGFTFAFVDSGTVQIRSAALLPGATHQAVLRPEIVVVTATKRPEVEAELPYALTVLSAPELIDARGRSTSDLTSQVAQLTATNLGPGQDKIFLRGLTDSIVPGLSESVVAIYLDNVRVGDDTPDPDLALVDVDRVEILSGPQGTLYGSGALEGLVRIVTHQPEMNAYDTAVSASLSSTKYGGISDDVNAVINLPLADDILALRLVAFTRDDAGYMDQTRLGIPDSNWTKTSGGRAALKWQPNAVWSATASLVYQQIRTGDAQYQDRSWPAYTRDAHILEPHSDAFLDGSIDIAASLGFAHLVSASAVVERRLDERFDASLAWSGLTGFPLGASSFDDGRRLLSYTHETRLVSDPGKRWEWLAGLFLSRRDEEFHSLLAGPDAAGARITARREQRDDNATEAAFFGELTYKFTDDASLTGGVRVFNASRDVTAEIASMIGDAGTFRGSNTQTGATPKLVASYRPMPDLLLYAQATEGYRLGGLNVDGPPGVSLGDDNAFDSDTLWNYEIGAKTRLFDGLVVARGATYFDKWKDVQTDQIGPDGGFFVLNAGTVSSLGAEAELAVGPIYNLSFHGNFFWNNARLTNANPSLVQTEGVLPAAPRTKYSLSARYDLPVRGYDAFVTGDFGYVGKSHIGFDERAPTMGGYHVADVGLGVSSGQWQALLFVNNLQNADEDTFGFGNPFDPNPQVTPPRPRTIGVSVTWHP